MFFFFFCYHLFLSICRSVTMCTLEPMFNSLPWLVCRGLATVRGKLQQIFCLPITVLLEHAIMKCLNLIGQYEGFKSLRATVRGLYM